MVEMSTQAQLFAPVRILVLAAATGGVSASEHKHRFCVLRLALEFNNTLFIAFRIMRWF